MQQFLARVMFDCRLIKVAFEPGDQLIDFLMSGRSCPGGGIILPRNLRTTFSILRHLGDRVMVHQVESQTTTEISGL